MKYLVLLAFLLVPSLHAAEAAPAPNPVALKLLDVLKIKDTMRNAFASSVETVAMNMRGGETTPAEINDMRQAMLDWFDQDFKWDDLRNQLADLYLKNFTVEELNQLIAFYQTPLGQKTLSKMSSVQREALLLGQSYALGKQAPLLDRLQKIDAKYKVTAPAKAAPAASAPAK